MKKKKKKKEKKETAVMPVVDESKDQLSQEIRTWSVGGGDRSPSTPRPMRDIK